jgi:glycosyltransferase involved in cell wall biosynthesis
MAESKGARNVFISLDTALPETFFPDELQVRKPEAGKLRLLWIGRFLPRKGILLLVDVMKALKGYTGISLTVVGDGEMRDAFREKVKEFSLQEIVYWKGAVPYDQVKEFYSNHDVFIFTSLRDSGGLQLVEAMAYGLPVVTLNLHGQAIIVNDETGIRCKCETPDIAIEELKNAVIELQQNPSRVSQMSLAAFEFAKKQTWTIKIAEISRKYYSL